MRIDFRLFDMASYDSFSNYRKKKGKIRNQLLKKTFCNVVMRKCLSSMQSSKVDKRNMFGNTE